MTMNQSKILCFAGSARKDSVNKKLARLAASCIERAGASSTFVDWSDYEIPLLNEDSLTANGFPKAVLELKTLCREHDGFLIASPEYNSSVSPLLKNVIDWASISLPDEPPLSLLCFKGKSAGLLSASPGGLGGLRGLFHLRDILQNIGVTVAPEMFALSHAYAAFDDSGSFNDPKNAAHVQSVALGLLHLTQKTAAMYAAAV